MKTSCIYEDPEGMVVQNPNPAFIASIFDRPVEFWQGGGNGDSSIKHVVVDPPVDLQALYRCSSKSGFRYALISASDSLYMKQPMSGRFFVMIDEDCSVDRDFDGDVIVDECGGNPFPIHPAYTVDKSIAREIALEFAIQACRPAISDWLPYSDMDIDWEAYL